MKKTLKLLAAFAVIICALTVAAAAVTLYAPDGRTIDVNYSEVNAYLNVGWYQYPVTMLYSIDGRSIVVAKSEVNAYKAVGWNEKTTLYASDGRTISVLPWEVNAYVAYGWSTEPFVTMYALDGRTISVPKSHVYSYTTVGWYENYDDVVQTLYASDGRTITVYKAQVASYVSVGWSTTPVYNTSGYYYSGTTIPKYNSYVYGVYEGYKYIPDTGLHIYWYKSSFSDKNDYIDLLETLGWDYFDSHVYDDYSMWTYTKGTMVVMVSFYYSNDRTYISFASLY